MTDAGFFPTFDLSGDGTRIAYLADAESDEVVELYGCPLDGSRPPLRLNRDMPIGPVEGDVRSFALSADGRLAVYRADQFEDEVVELLRASTDGPRAFARLNAALVPGGDVEDFQLSPDGARVAYLADQDVDGVFELYGVPSDASQPPARLNAALVTGGDVRPGFVFTPDGARVVYTADQEQDGVVELYSAPFDGSAAPVELSGAPFHTLLRFQISPDGARVVFAADLLSAGVIELFSAPIDGSAAPVRLSAPMTPGGSVRWSEADALRITPAGRVLYLADQDVHGVVELYGVPLDGSAPAVKLNGPVFGPTSVGLAQVSADGLSVVYRANQLAPERFDLFRVPIDAGAVPVPLTATLPDDAAVQGDYRIAPGDARVVYRARGTGGLELFSVPLDASAPPVKLNGPLGSGSVRALQNGQPVFQFSRDGSRVAYTAQEDSARIDLFVVPTDGSAPPRRLSQGSQLNVRSDFRFTPDGSALLYRAQYPSTFALLRARVDGTRLPQRVGPDSLSDGTFALSARGDRVVYLGTAAQVTDLWLAFLGRFRSSLPSTAPVRPRALAPGRRTAGRRRAAARSSREGAETPPAQTAGRRRRALPALGMRPVQVLPGARSGYSRHPLVGGLLRRFVMQSISLFPARVLFFLPCLALPGATPSAGALVQADAPESDPGFRRALVLEGFVLAPDGNAAAGAVVVSSAGGRAVTDAAGSYRLEVTVPDAATEVQITALGRAGRNLAASARVSVSAALQPTRVHPLQLARGTACTPSWIPTFGTAPGTPAANALAVFDGGSGPELHAGDPNGTVARFDGSRWHALGGGMDGAILALAAHDDGSGPALFAAGSFLNADGAPASRIARWDGASWTAVGGGMNGRVQDLIEFDDGSGLALYAAGWFTTAGGVPANRVAKWDGSSWSALGGGLSGRSGRAFALGVHDDGSGSALYVGGNFSVAGNVAADRVARWDGTSWSALGSGADGQVLALRSFDDGGGAKLYAGGQFSVAGGVTGNRIARWDGASWSAVGGGLSSRPEHAVRDLVVHDDGSGLALYAGGHLPHGNMARWNGASWSALGSGLAGEVLALAQFDDGGGPALYAGGAFGLSGAPSRVARWDGAKWVEPRKSLDGEVRALAWHDDGSGSALYAGGFFTYAGEVPASRIARWDGSGWAPLGTGISGLGSGVMSMASYDEGNGPALFVGGRFTFAGSAAVRNLARWDGASWSSVGDGPAGVVYALLTHDDGSGPALYVGGSFITAAGVSALRIARWDGVSWSPVGSGSPWAVLALAEFDDGSGPALYAGGSFGVRRWDGASWTQLDSGIPGSVTALAVFDDGAGPKLYAGGAFATAGGINARNLASWDGSGWAAVGSGTNDEVLALLAHDDGGGMALHVGGRFSIAGGLSASRLARWDGTSWSALGGGVAGRVAALVSGEAGGVPALYAGGNLTGTDTGDLHLARRGCLDTSAPVLACPTPFAVLDRARNGSGEVVHFTVGASDDFDPEPLVVCTPPSGSVFPLGTTLVDCTATDASGNQSTCQFAVTVQAETRSAQR